MEVGHFLVRLRGPRATQVRPGYEGTIAVHLDLRLEGVGEIGLPLLRFDRRAVVHEEDRDRARPLRDVLLEIHR